MGRVAWKVKFFFNFFWFVAIKTYICLYWLESLVAYAFCLGLDYQLVNGLPLI